MIRTQVNKVSLNVAITLCTVLFLLIGSSRSVNGEPNGPASNGDGFRVADKSSFPVIPSPNSHHVETKEQLARWKHALSACNPRKLEFPLTDLCLSALTDYFNDEPIWDYSEVYYYDALDGLKRAPTGLNLRHRYLPYGYDDYALDEIPRWRDIFDDRLHERIELYRQIRADATCENIRHPSVKGIQEEKSEQCQAREMYKYASYIDACVTAMKRSNLFSLPPPSTQFAFRHSSVYKMGEHLIEDHINEAHLRDLASLRLKKGYLQAVWAIEKCQDGYTLLPVKGGIWSSQADSPEESFTDEFSDRLVLENYFALLKTAAKSGDEWAIRSFPMGVFTSGDFNDDVTKRYPLLMHRHLGSLTGGFRSELDLTSKNRHQAKAFLLLEKQAGTTIARREFNFAELEKEIELVRKGGTLKYPDEMYKASDETDMKQSTEESSSSLDSREI